MLFYTFYQGGEIKGTEDKWYFYSSSGKRKDISSLDVSDIYFFHETTATSDFFRYAGGKKVKLHFLKYGFYQTTFIPFAGSSNMGVYAKQYHAYKNEETRLQIAKTIVTMEIHSAGLVWGKFFPWKTFSDKLLNADTIEKVRNVEAMAMKMFWGMYKSTFPDFTGRIYNPPPDMYNALISFAYAHLYGAAFSAIKLVGLEPRIGYLHENRFRTYTLHLDIADMYKPLVADFVFNLFEKRIVSKTWFEKIGIGVFLKEQYRPKFTEYWDDFLRSKGKWCRGLSFLVMLVKDARDLRGYIVSGERRWKPCLLKGEV